MKMFTPAVVLLAGWLLTMQASGQAPPPAPSSPKTAQTQQKPAPHEVATHATKGVVKSVSSTAVVITRQAGGKQTETSFVVTPTTQRAGTVAAGATVEIRYRTEGKQRIATAISVEAPPQ
jgi:hypothetical protein